MNPWIGTTVSPATMVKSRQEVSDIPTNRGITQPMPVRCVPTQAGLPDGVAEKQNGGVCQIISVYRIL